MQPFTAPPAKPSRLARPWRNGLFQRGFIGLLVVVAGCENHRRLKVPEISPKEASERALAEYDRNGDGFLEPKELERSPALKSCWKAWDTDGDGRLSAQEIADRLAVYQASHLAVITVRCKVTLDEQPLVGATVTFTPEAFLGPAIQPASGITDANGFARLERPGKKLPGMNCGLYRIEVSKRDADGKETVPASYNTRTALGQEIGPDWRGTVTLALTTPVAKDQ
jgi:hypothetical protein